MSHLQYDDKPDDVIHRDSIEKGEERDLPARTSGRRNINHEFAEALVGTHYKKWDKNSMILYLGCFVAFLSSYASGYDGSLMSSLMAMRPFQVQIKPGNGITPEERNDGRLGGLNAIFQVGAILGGPCNSYTMDTYGRRWAQVAGAVIIILGTILTSTSKEYGQFMVGRLLLGAGSAFAQAAPAYAMEIARPQWRGRVTSIYNVGWFAGAIPAAAICFGTNFLTNNLSWQLPLIFQCVTSVLICGLIWFVPESPRFLMSKGREEEAHQFLTRYHGGGDPEAPLVKLELEEMRASFNVNKLGKWWDYGIVFKTHSGRWRITQVVMMGICGQFSGNGLAYYITLVFKSLGIESVSTQLAYNIVSNVVSAAGATIGALLADRMPRRKVLTIGPLCLSALLAIYLGINSKMHQEQAKTKTEADPQGVIPRQLAQGALAVYMLFNALVAFVYTPLQSTLPVEALGNNIRAKGLAIYVAVMMSTGFINQFAQPVGLNQIGYLYMIVPCVFDFCSAIAWYLVGVESCGRTLEELDYIYAQKYPPGASKHFNREGKLTEEAIATAS